jgi:hypothetical protein
MHAFDSAIAVQIKELASSYLKLSSLVWPSWYNPKSMFACKVTDIFSLDLVPLAIQARVKRLHMPRSLVWSLYMDTNLEKKYKYNDPIIFS